MDNRQSHLLKICMFATGCAGIVAEFTLSTLASYLLGNTTLQWTLVMSLMLFAMGLGSRWSRLFTDHLLDRFISIEFLLSILCATSSAAAYFGAAFIDSIAFVIYGYALAIGILIGMEIPLVARLNEAYEELRTNISSVMEKDYYGALAGGVFFAFFALPKLGLTYTPVVLGAVNFAVASILLWRYRNLLTHRHRLIATFWGMAIGLMALSIFMRPIVMFGEQSRYRDRIVFEAQTAYQRIVITQWKNHHWLYLNGSVQFSTYDEARYHEPLVHPAMQLASTHARVLILGGGDGLALREVLKYPGVSSATLVDLDQGMIDLAKSNPIFIEANKGSLSDPRVHIVIGDAGRFLEQSSDLFDIIIIDLPDPKDPDLARLYSREFYHLCSRHLSTDGVIVTQASSPLHSPHAFLCIYRTMVAAEFSVMPYHNYVPTMGDWGFMLGMRGPLLLEKGLDDRAKELDFSKIETQFLNQEAMLGMLQFWKDIFADLNSIIVSTELEPTVDRYYRKAEWGW